MFPLNRHYLFRGFHISFFQPMSKRKREIMKPFIILIGIIIFALTFSTPILSVTLYKWTDENGVMHISDRPPPEGIEHKRSKYKNAPVNNQSKTKKSNYMKKQDAEKLANERELESVKRDKGRQKNTVRKMEKTMTRRSPKTKLRGSARERCYDENGRRIPCKSWVDR